MLIFVSNLKCQIIIFFPGPNTNMATVLDAYVNETVVMSCETNGETASWFHNSKPISFASSSDVRLGPTAKLLIPSANVSLFECLHRFINRHL